MLVKALILLAVIVLLWLLLRPRPASRAQDPRPPRPQPQPQPQEIVACEHCGVHVPREDALPGPEGVSFYCCEAHRCASPRS